MTKATIIPSLTNNPPSRANPAAFPTDGDSFLNDLPDVVSGVNTVATELNTWNYDISELQYSAGLSATNASNSKDTSLGNARLAASWFLSGWVSGTTYPAGQIVYSNVDGREYKRITAGAGTTDPSSDTTNWEPLGWEYITNYPDIRPTLDLNFAGSQAVDPRITFTRNSTATYFDKFGVMQTAGVNQPRIDFDPVTGECKGLLIEEQRTNLLLYSSEFDNTAWVKVNTTITANAALAPDGTITADLLTETNAAGGHTIDNRFQGTSGFTEGKYYTVSCYAKLASGTRNLVFSSGNAGIINFVSVFNLSDGVVVSKASGVTATITNCGNGFYRCTASALAASSSGTLTAIGMSSGTVPSYTGDGTSGIYIWGAQLEVGAFPTSYIPTEASQVTRAADAASMTGASFSSWYRQDEGTIVSECTDTIFSGGSVNLSDGTPSNRITYYANQSNSFEYIVTAAGVGQVNLAGIARYAYPTFSKLALAYKQADFAAAGKGAVSASSVGVVPSTINRLTIGAAPGHIKRIAYYPKRLPNATLQAITQP